MRNPEDKSRPGEVWQESDGVLLLCTEPGKWWQDFRGDKVPWDSPHIARPLRLLLDPEGNLVASAPLALEQAFHDKMYEWLAEFGVQHASYNAHKVAESFVSDGWTKAGINTERDLYDVALQVTDEALGKGTYARINKGNPDPGVQAAIKRAKS